MKYLVMGTEGPTFYGSEDAVDLLEQVIVPTFEILKEFEDDGTIVGGVPVGDRAVVFIAEAESNDDLDQMIRSLPIWPLMDWEVTPLQDVEARAGIEQEILKNLKSEI